MRTTLLQILAIALASVGLIALSPAPSANAALFVCDNTAANPLRVNDPTLKVVVREGDSCFIVNSVIHSLRASDPKNVSFLGSTMQHGVAHNIMIDGATGNVVIGNAGCKYDPRVGNNIRVTNSFNVLICEMVVDNNIMVTGNSGRVTVRDSIACNNITVSRNRPYAGTARDHRNPGTIRLINLVAGGQVFTKNNAGRQVIRRNVEESDMSPGQCRKAY